MLCCQQPTKNQLIFYDKLRERYLPKAGKVLIPLLLPFQDPPKLDPKTGQPVKYGFYSPKAHRNSSRLLSHEGDGKFRKDPGACYYWTPDGRKVKVTAVYDSRLTAFFNYLWTDKIFVGQVTEYAGEADSGDPMGDFIFRSAGLLGLLEWRLHELQVEEFY